MVTPTRVLALVLATVAGAGGLCFWTTRAVAARATDARGPAKTSEPVPSGSGSWSGRELVIAPGSLGAVTVGMTLAEAQKAAGYTFDDSGDGFVYPTALPRGYPHEYVGEAATNLGDDVSCVGVQTRRPELMRQTVVTPEGFRLGDTVQHFLAIYRASAKHVAAPPTGMTTDEGFVVAEHGGYLAFTEYRDKIVAIAGTTGAAAAGTVFDQNSCTG